MAVNDGTKFTNFSNIQVGSSSGGGGVKCGVPVTITDAATYTVLSYNSGKLHVAPNFTASCTVTLPTAEAGLNYKFIYGGAAADAQNLIIQASAAGALMKGGVVHLDTDAGAAGDEVVPVFADASNDIILTITTPDAGTEVNFVCDGTYWYVSGFVVSAAAPAFS